MQVQQYRGGEEEVGASGASILRFGVFELDLKGGQLRKAGVLVKLQPQPFKVLAGVESPNRRRSGGASDPEWRVRRL